MRWSFVVPLLALLLAPSVARADAEADAKAAFSRGRTLFKAGRYAEAVAELKKAYSLKPHPALLRYMGDTYYKMNKARLAIQHYKKYLQEAPEAADRDKIEGKVKQLELIVGASEEEGPASAPVAPSGPVPELEPEPKTRIEAPTGEDREVPVALRRRATLTPRQEQPVEAPRRTRPVAVMKWTALGAGAAGLVMGIVFNRLAASKASELEDAVRNDCPASSPACGGNPDMNKPVVAYSERHYNLQQSNQLYRTLSLSTFIVGGVLAGTAAVLFILDRGGERRPAGSPSRASLTPVLGGNTWGVAGAVGF